MWSAATLVWAHGLGVSVSDLARASGLSRYKVRKAIEEEAPAPNGEAIRHAVNMLWVMRGEPDAFQVVCELTGMDDMELMLAGHAAGKPVYPARVKAVRESARLGHEGERLALCLWCMGATIADVASILDITPTAARDAFERVHGAPQLEWSAAVVRLIEQGYITHEDTGGGVLGREAVIDILKQG